MRYYELDKDGKVKGSYAVPQPGKGLILLEDAPDDESKWDGQKWVPDEDIIKAKLAAKDEAEKEVLVQAKMRERAIVALKAEGKLTAAGELVKPKQ